MLRNLDLELLVLLRTKGHSAPVERKVAAFSRLGEHSFLWFTLAAAGAVFQPRRRRLYRQLAVTVATVEVTNSLAKIAIARKRPILDRFPPLMDTRSQRSFPSAHASSSFAAARVLSEAWPRLPVYGLAAAMALSRPYLGVHYPSDIGAGALFGTWVAALTGARPVRKATEAGTAPSV